MDEVISELAEQQSEPAVLESRVLIIMTGGTICMRQSPSGFVPARGFQEQCLARVPTFNDGSRSTAMDVVVDAGGTVEGHPSLRTPQTAYGRRVRYTVFEFDELLDSSSIDAKGWAQIAETVKQNYVHFDGFVVLHGTDSLAYTCSALSFMLQNLGKPVVLTGSQAPMLELQNDATDNLLGSLVVASHFMIPEVCLYFNNRLFRGNRASKVSASDFAAFASPNCPPLAVTTSMRTNVNWELVNRPNNIEHFNIQTNLDTTHVACLRIFPGIKPEMVDAVLRLDGLRGLVLETFGAGNAPHGQDNAMTKVLADAIKRGIVIVNVTQCKFSVGFRAIEDGPVANTNRPDWQRGPGLRHGHESVAGRRRRRPGYDDGGGADQVSLPSGPAGVVAGDGGQEHVHLAARRAERGVATDVPSSGRRTAGTGPGAHDPGVRDRARRPRARPGHHEGGAPLDPERRRLFRQHSDRKDPPPFPFDDQSINPSLAPCGLVAVGRHSPVPAPGRRIGAHPEPQRTHAAVPGGERELVGARYAAAQVGGAFAFRRAAGGDAAGATAAGDLGLGWDRTSGDQ